MNPQPPPRRTCGAMIHYHTLLETDPEFRAQQFALHQQTQALACARLQERVGLVLVPVVVHVLYNKDVENITQAQVQSQIQVLNADYSATNADLDKVPAIWKPLIADTQIRFTLATTDPSGQPTTGITRKWTPKSSFAQGDEGMKRATLGGVDAWDTTRYLNLWVCTLAAGILGYSQFPGGPADTDGVVILNTVFGTTGTVRPPFDQGRTATHEVGHWFNLFHLWGDGHDCQGTDYVDDTPNSQLPNFGSPTYPHVSCNNAPSGDMFMNFMDYCSDGDLVFFTRGQVQRMRATLSGPRSSLGT